MKLPVNWNFCIQQKNTYIVQNLLVIFQLELLLQDLRDIISK